MFVNTEDYKFVVFQMTSWPCFKMSSVLVMLICLLSHINWSSINPDLFHGPLKTRTSSTSFHLVHSTTMYDASIFLSSKTGHIFIIIGMRHTFTVLQILSTFKVHYFLRYFCFAVIFQFSFISLQIRTTCYTFNTPVLSV